MRPGNSVFNHMRDQFYLDRAQSGRADVRRNLRYGLGGKAMYKRILVAIDESATSDLALGEAINLAKDQNAVLQLVHVVDLTPICLTEETPYPYVECQKAMEERGEKILASHATTVREAGIEVDSKLITIKLLSVSIYDVIEEQSKRWPADLIVIGTHGRRGFQHAREAAFRWRS